jgi:hypothetical protein
VPGVSTFPGITDVLAQNQKQIEFTLGWRQHRDRRSKFQFLLHALWW